MPMCVSMSPKAGDVRPPAWFSLLAGAIGLQGIQGEVGLPGVKGKLGEGPEGRGIQLWMPLTQEGLGSRDGPLAMTDSL